MTIDPVRSSTSKTRRSVHKRTLAVVFCLVMVPWILIAVPGESSGGGGTSGINVSLKRHGWPFVHLDSTHAEVYGNWNQLPEIDADVIASEWASIDENNPKPSSLQLNLGMHRARFWREDQPGIWSEPGFWSEPSNWPSWSTGWKLSFRPLGMFCNFLCLGVVAVFVAIPVEIRIRRCGRLLKFSLTNMLVFVAIAATFMAWLGFEHSRSSTEERRLQKLQELESAREISLNIEYESRFPLLFSQLFNHGRFPWGNSVLFRQTRECSVILGLDDSDSPERVKQLSRILADSHASVYLDVLVHDESMVKMLSEFHDVKIVELNIHFDIYDWVYQEIGEENHHLDWDEAVKLADLKFDPKNRFPHLETLSLSLDPSLNQKELLKHFCDLPSLQHADLFELSEEGVSYILKTRAQWPEESSFECADDVSDNLKSSLKQAFPQSGKDLENF